MKNKPAVTRGLLVCLLVLITIALASSCGEKKLIPAVGPYSDVWLFTEEGKFSPLLRQFTEELAGPITYVFETENEFSVYLREGGLFSKNRDRKNLIVLVRTDRPGKLRKQMSKMLGQDILARVRREGRLVLFKQDLFARDQDVFIVLVNGGEQEEYVLSNMSGELRQRLRESTQARYLKYLLLRENKGGGKYLWQNYQFALRFPPEYALLNERRDLGAIELHRKGPSRVLGVFWLNGVDAMPALSDSVDLVAFRAGIVDTLYGGDRILAGETSFRMDRLGDRDAVRMQGVWQNEEDMTGGPFVTYFVHDDKRQRLLAVDLLLYAPGLEKHPYMRELEALASTLTF